MKKFKQGIGNRLEKTKLKVFEKMSLVADNSSILMKSVQEILDFSTTTLARHIVSRRRQKVLPTE